MQSNTPARLNIEQARNQAKDLLNALKSRDPAASRRFRTTVPQLGAYSDDQIFSAKLALHDAQRVIAIEHGCQSWQELVAHVRRSISPPYSVDDLIGFFVAVKDWDAEGVSRALDAQPTLVEARLLDDNYMLEGNAFREGDTERPTPCLAQDADGAASGVHGVLPKRHPGRAGNSPHTRGARSRRQQRGLGREQQSVAPPITLASWEGGLDMMRLLLDAGADVSGEHGVAALENRGPP